MQCARQPGLPKHIWCVLAMGLSYLAGGGLLLALLYWSSNCVVVTTDYTAKTGQNAEAVIALLSDLHGKSFGEGNRIILGKVREMSPDVICLCGDMFSDSAHPESRETQWLEELGGIAPVYISVGNHDLFLRSRAWKTRLEELGCTILDAQYRDLTLNGLRIRLGGMYENPIRIQTAAIPGNTSDAPLFLEAFQDTDAYRILLCHRPETLTVSGASDRWGMDLILCGHTHGGLVRLPFFGGVVAPGQGLFPKYDYGLFPLGDHTRMIVTSGFAGYGRIPRVNNPPEIALIRLVP